MTESVLWKSFSTWFQLHFLLWSQVENCSQIKNKNFVIVTSDPPLHPPFSTGPSPQWLCHSVLVTNDLCPRVLFSALGNKHRPLSTKRSALTIGIKAVRTRQDFMCGISFFAQIVANYDDIGLNPPSYSGNDERLLLESNVFWKKLWSESEWSHYGKLSQLCSKQVENPCDPH